MDDSRKVSVVKLLTSETLTQVESCRKIFSLGEEFDPVVDITFMKGTPCGGYDLDEKLKIWFPTGQWLKFVGTSDRILFQEYTPFEHHPIIGSYTGGWKAVLSVVLCHELAHCLVSKEEILDSFIKKVPKRYRDDRRSHGLLWQYVYSQTRPPVVSRYENETFSK